MPSTIIDHLTTLIDFKTNTTGIVKAEREMDKFREKTEKANEVLEFFKRGIEILGIALAAEKINEWANEWDNAKNKLSSVGITGTELITTLSQLKNIADTSGTSIGAVAELYQQLDSTMGEMVGKKDLLTMVDNLNKVFAINATEAGSAKAAMMDMAKGLENQTVNWMEIKRAMMDVPGLANIINRHFKQLGTTTAEALQGGTFASKDFVKILIDSQDEINKQFARTAKTVPMAVRHLINSFEEFFSTLRENTGITDFLVNSINGLANVFSNVAQWISSHGNTMKAAMIAIAAVITTVFAPSLAALAVSIGSLALAAAPFILGLGSLVLLLDDFITYIKGGNSVIGSAISYINKWWTGLKQTYPAIAQISKFIGQFISELVKLTSWFFKSGQAFKIMGGIIKVLEMALNNMLEVLNAIILMFKTAITVISYFVSSIVTGITSAWGKLVAFKNWISNNWVNIGKAIAKPFIGLADIILSPIKRVMNWLKSSTVGKWVANKLGVDLKAEQSKNNFNVTPINKLMPNNMSNVSSVVNTPSFSDNSTVNVSVSVPTGTDDDTAIKLIKSAIMERQQEFRSGVLNHDSKIVL
jgi:hypothetical protein